MGKAQAGRVDSDYSGRPLGRPTKEEVAEAMARSTGDGPSVGGLLKDGRHVLVGPDRKWYHEHVVDGRQVWDRPVDPKDLK